MNLNQIFNPKGSNYWIIALAFASNLLFALVVMLIAFIALDYDADKSSSVQIGLILTYFIGPLAIGWFSGRIAFDNQGPTYGVLGSFACVTVILITLITSGLFAILLAVVALAGGFNGGVLSQAARKKKP